ncbi:MAG: TonB-dependent receptor [Acidobacteriota bacterium]
MTVEATPDGQWIVLGAPSGTVEGCLTSDPGERPIVDASVTVAGSGQEASSDLAGCFRLLNVGAGERVLEVSRPGYLGRSLQLEVSPGTHHRADLRLRIDAETRDEILVAATPEEPPLGTWRLSRTLRESAQRTEGDVVSAVADSPGVLRETGVSFGVRGAEARRVTLVVDGMSIVEPYHFRDLGSLASAVTPEAVGEVQLHRGTPPLVYGNQAGGVLEMTTKAATGRIAGSAGVATESYQAGGRGSMLGGRGRWLAAFRRGRPDLPREIGQINATPTYWDATVKSSLALTDSRDLSLRVLLAQDDFLFQDQEFQFPGQGFLGQSLQAGQDSRHASLRYLASVGSRHLIETSLFDVEVDRLRTANEIDASILVPNPLLRRYSIEDRRETRRRSLRIQATSNLSEQLDLEWGAEVAEERTLYDYRDEADFRPPFGLTFAGRLKSQPTAVFSQGVWRPRADLTIKTGLRWDSDSQLMPRLSFSLHRRQAVWSGSLARVTSVASTYELPLADAETFLSDVEVTDYLSLGYRRTGSLGFLSIEAYLQRIAEPRVRFANLYKPISRIPELEQDRIRLAPAEGRTQGLEIRSGRQARDWRAEATYVLSRSEDLLDGSWLPRREDRRHTLTLLFSTSLRAGLSADFRWYGATGQPTTPLDLERLGLFGAIADAIGAYHSERLPDEHQLNIRLVKRWTWKSLGVAAELGIDNVYDNPRVRGFDLFSVGDVPPSLPVELGLGRRVLWGLEFSW